LFFTVQFQRIAATFRKNFIFNLEELFEDLFPKNKHFVGIGETWMEMQKTVNLNFFTENDLEECGSTIFQDSFGIVYQIFIKGKDSKVFPALYEPRTIILSCFYPLTDTPVYELPLDVQDLGQKKF